MIGILLATPLSSIGTAALGNKKEAENEREREGAEPRPNSALPATPIRGAECLLRAINGQKTLKFPPFEGRIGKNRGIDKR